MGQAEEDLGESWAKLAEEIKVLFSNGLKIPPTPNEHSASGRGLLFRGAYESIPTRRRKEVRRQRLCLLNAMPAFNPKPRFSSAWPVVRDVPYGGSVSKVVWL